METSLTQTYQEVFFAHQPIFDSSQKVWGYEIYFRNDESNNKFLLNSQDEVAATREILSNISFCPDQKLRQVKVVINFTEDAILKGHAYALHPDTINIQLPDKDTFRPEVTSAIRQLNKDGYSISIDDYKAHPGNFEIYSMSDVLTINVLALSNHETARLLKSNPEIAPVYLAKKIEHQDHFQHAKNLGFSLFQGFFFQRPKTNRVRKISSVEMIRFEILELLCSPDATFETISESISKDASLSVRLLNLLNSPAYGLIQQITSLKQAAVYLGMEHLKQWLRVIILTDIEQPDITKELLRVSLLRAKFLEHTGNRNNLGEEHNRLFILGLFSLLDSMYQMPMTNIMNCLSALDEEIRKTLIGQETPLTAWLNLAVSMQNSDWTKVGAYSAQINLDPVELMPSYLDALKWANLAIQACSR